MSPHQLSRYKQRIHEEDSTSFPEVRNEQIATPEVAIKEVKDEEPETIRSNDVSESATTTTTSEPQTPPTKDHKHSNVVVNLIPTEKCGFSDYSKYWFKDKYLVLVDDYICLPGDQWVKQSKVSAEKHVTPFTEIVNALKGRKVVPNTAKSLILITPKHIMTTKELSIIQRNKVLIQRLQ